MKTGILSAAILAVSTIVCAGPTIWMVGDSTMASYPEKRAPMEGWGQALNQYCKPEVKVENKASSGRSSKSFIDEGKFKAFADKMQKGDYLIIQFGHNDQKQDDPKRYTDPANTFSEHLMVYINAAREKEVTPVLATSIARRQFKDGQLRQSLGGYPDAIRKLAKEQNLALVDLNQITMTEFQKLGEADSVKLFNHLEPGENPNYPKGSKDNTHLCGEGAKTIAGWFVEDTKKQNLPIAELFK